MRTKKELQKNIIVYLGFVGKPVSVFAQELGVSRQVVYKWLRTDCVTFDKLFELMGKLDMEWDIDVVI